MAATPLMFLNTLERADAALAAGEVITARRIVSYARRELECVKRSQDIVLDEVARVPEPIAPRETPPRGSGEQR